MMLRLFCSSIAFVITLFLSISTFAQTYSVPATSTTGTYTITFSTSTTYALVEELYPDGSWRPIGSVNQNLPGTASVTKAVSGTYTYHLKYCSAGQQGQSCSILAGTKSIVVTLSPSGGGGSGGTLPTPDTPAAPPVDSGSTTPVGSLEANFRVNEFGAATYEIPISIADGIAGVKPELSVIYSSQGGNGLLGLGASLIGISTITRCRQTLVHDGQAKPVQWNSEDRFCLNGQRLMLISGTYGSNSSTYKTEIDSYVLITAIGGSAGNPEYFTLEAKDGSKTYFGYDSEASNSSRITTPAGQYLSWGQSMFMDNMQNRIHYVYESGKLLKQILYAYPAPFSYGGALARVEFTYETRTDTSLAYMPGGVSLQTEKRLQYIRSFSKEINTENLIRKYEFRYTAGSSGLSRLSSALECMSETSTNCYRETTFSWQDPQIGFATAEVAAVVPDAIDVKSQIFMDIDGDGKQELVWMSSSGSNRYIKYATIGKDCPPTTGRIVILSPTCSHIDVKLFASGQNKITYTAVSDSVYSSIQMIPIDYNADGRQDLMVYKPPGVNSISGGTWNLYASVPDMSGGWRLVDTPVIMPFTSDRIRFGDVNSDGLVDAYDWVAGAFNVYKLQKSGSAISYLYYSYNSSPTVYPIVGLKAGGVGTPEYTLGDFNADGQMDILANYTRYENPCSATGCAGPSPQIREILVLLNNGSQFVVNDSFTSLYDYIQPTYGMGCSPCYTNTFELQSFMTTDINGDGLADLVYNTHRYTSGDWSYRINNGSSFVQGSTLISDYPFDVYNKYKHTPMFSDFNQDGYPDIFWHDKNQQTLNYKIWNPSSSSFGSAQVLPGGMGNRNHTYALGDLDGDGISDLYKISVTNSNASLELKVSAGIKDVKDNKIYKITDGVGKAINIDYGTLSNSTHYATIRAPKTGYSFVPCYEPQDSNYATCEFAATYETSQENFYSNLNDPFPTNRGAYSDGPILNLMSPFSIVTQATTSAPISGNSNNPIGIIKQKYKQVVAGL